MINKVGHFYYRNGKKSLSLIGACMSIDGYGELRYCNDDVYKGEWRLGVKHGKVSMHFNVCETTYYEVVC